MEVLGFDSRVQGFEASVRSPEREGGVDFADARRTRLLPGELPHQAVPVAGHDEHVFRGGSDARVGVTEKLRHLDGGGVRRRRR